MISEYALDPNLLAQRFSEEPYFFNNAFGVEGRILSQYPSSWKRAVWDAFAASALGRNPLARTKLEALMVKLSTSNSVRRGNSHGDIQDWLQRAQREHIDRPFRGILAGGNPADQTEIIPFDVLMEDGGHDLWCGTHSCQPLRQKASLAEAVASLLRCSRHIVFVDPYFAPQQLRFSDSISEFVRVAMDRRSVPDVPRVDIITTETDRHGTPLQGADLASALVFLKDKCSERIRPKIAAEIDVYLSVYLEIAGGQEIHERYILTEIAAVKFGKGLDCELNQASTTRDDLVLLSYDVGQSLWEWYVSGQPKPFNVALSSYQI